MIDMTKISSLVIARRRVSRRGDLIEYKENRTDSKRFERLLHSARNDKRRESLLCIIFILAGCIIGHILDADAASSLQISQGQSSAIANPASVNCVDKRGGGNWSSRRGRMVGSMVFAGSGIEMNAKNGP
jgi:hypothetical protein